MSVFSDGEKEMTIMWEWDVTVTDGCYLSFAWLRMLMFFNRENGRIVQSFDDNIMKYWNCAFWLMALIC